MARIPSVVEGRLRVPSSLHDPYLVLRFLADDLGKRLDDVLDSILRAMANRRLAMV